MRPHTFSARTLCSLAATLLAAHAALAQEDAADCALRIGSGPKGGVYELVVRDIQTVCGNEVSVCAVPSAGGLQNLMKLSASEADLGISQLDTLQEMARGGDENLRNLQAVMPLHGNLLHVLALREGSKLKGSGLGLFGETRQIRKFSDLKGVRVALVGSAQLLGQTLNNQLGYEMEFVVADNDDQALKLLQANKVQAIFTSGGWPMPNITRYEHGSGLVLVEYDLSAHPPFVAVKRNYQNMGAFNFSFLAAPNLLLTRPFKPAGDMGKKVAILQSCLLRNLERLQEGRFSAAWKEIKSPTDTLGIARFTRADGQKSARVSTAQREAP
jgi:TRAP-type uncharacterized transport system substrate-binding protein